MSLNMLIVFFPSLPRLQLLLQARLQSPLDGVEVLVRCDPAASVLFATSKREILGHDAVNIDGVNASLLELLGKDDKLGSVVKLTTLGETLCPGVDGGNGVGRGLVALLVLAVVASDG